MGGPMRNAITSIHGRLCSSAPASASAVATAAAATTATTARSTSVRRLTSSGQAKASVLHPLTQPAPPSQRIPLADALPPCAPAQSPATGPPSAPSSNYCLRSSQKLPNDVSGTYFDTSGALLVGLKGQQPPDPNKAKLGRTLRVLQERLPTLLQSPLPQDILAPNISLQLFPTTHPHLPTVSGRVAYNAALWTSPIAWNRVPIIGNVKLEILAERMTSEPLTFLPRRSGAIPEQLVVRWCEKRKARNDDVGSGGGSGAGSIAKSLRFGRGVDPQKAFTGLFIFDFDAEGRVLTHTIEHAQESGNWEKGMGAKFVGLTDWLLGGIKDPGETPLPMFEKLRKRRHY